MVEVFDNDGRLIHDGTEDISRYGEVLLSRQMVAHVQSSAAIQSYPGEQSLRLVARVTIADQPLGGVVLLLDASEVSTLIGSQ